MATLMSQKPVSRVDIDVSEQRQKWYTDITKTPELALKTYANCQSWPT